MTTTATPILTRKLQHMFNLLDVDQDGYLTMADLPALADALAVPFAAQPEKIQTLREALLRIWEAHLGQMDENGDGRLDTAEYERGIRAATAEDPKAFLRTMHAAVAAWFSLFDTNGDGHLDLDEYTQLGQAIGGISPQDMAKAFQRLDRDGDGRLQPEEIRVAVIEFFTSEDPDADGNWLYGPL
ncbi:EF-hand domain-containing protein [Streptomyces sp. NBC_00503]|uniref:EF-hand domain-containing protein n=1 Tax=Streptomyces sp. NBC_00503 TaxID=2903659 RepID=UPI002E807959|nr:EF-hand domain-containing protein [Streptomyces sp. NBC_00503]WUD79137.1 EF-hand domain-containing protein [Streptomyces sp. NBC_00503]